MAYRGRGTGNRGRGHGASQGPRDHQRGPLPPAQSAECEDEPKPSVGQRRKRAQTWRKDMSTKVINEFNKVSLEKTKSEIFGKFSSLSDALKTAHVEPQAQSVKISFATRGVGLTLFETLQRVGVQLPQLDIPIFSFYRISLLQLAAKHDQILLSADVGFCDYMAGVSGLLLDSDTRALVLMNALNVSPVSGVNNCFGRFSIEGVSYSPAFLSAVSPGMYNIGNLREIVDMLSNPNTPLADRQEYVNLNCIPGARFHDELEPLLINADDVMPAEYTVPMVRNDFMLVKACLANIGRKLPKLIGSVISGGKGNPDQLLTTARVGSAPRIWSFVEWSAQRNNYEAVHAPYIEGDSID